MSGNENDLAGRTVGFPAANKTKSQTEGVSVARDLGIVVFLSLLSAVLVILDFIEESQINELAAVIFVVSICSVWFAYRRCRDLVAALTRRQQAEEEMRKSEEKLAGIVASSTDPMIMVDEQFNVLWTNDVAKALFGPDMVGQKCHAAYRGSDKVCESCIVRECFNDGRYHDFETEITGADGKQRTFWTTASVAAWDTDGRPKMVVEFLRDITERKQAKEELRKAYEGLERRIEERTADLARATERLKQELTERRLAEKALRESEEKYRSLASTDDSIYLLDRDCRYLFMNEKHLSRTGLPDVIGRTYAELHSQEETKELLEKVEEVFKTGRPVQHEHRSSRDGRYFLRTLSPVKDQGGRTISVTAVSKDITERRLGEEEKTRLEQQLRHAQKMEAIGTLAGGIAHNFNNLLMGIQGNTSLMLLNMDPSHPHYKKLKIIEKQVESGARLAWQLLGYARKGKYEVKPINLNRAVEETSDAFGKMRKEITIHRELAEDLSTIEADQGQIEQVLLNLYVNAADAMPGGGKLTLKTTNTGHEDMKGELHPLKPGKYVWLRVTDAGIGMDKETMERVFDPFFTTKEIGRGTGLGLPSAYGIIEGHGGYITIESQKGHGTTVNIYFPASERKAQKELATTPGEIIRGTETVLLVEDEEENMEVGQKFLEAMGYRVFIARDGEEAIQIYKQNRDDTDIVLLDLIIPNMSGGEIYDRLKEINPDIKVLLTSGYSIDSEASQLLKGCNGFIQKPFNMSELSRKIREILGTQQDL